jgi:hypothetical protein
MKDQTLNFLCEVSAIVLISGSMIINKININTSIILFTIGLGFLGLKYIGQEEVKKVKKK